MNRLTRRGKTGQAAPVKRIEVVCLNQTGNANLNEIFEHIASYEDIGLTPDQIREVDRLYAEKCREVAELKAEIKELQNSIDNQPTADAEPVRHAHWIVYDDIPVVWCSGCESLIFADKERLNDKVHYCPHCGAKMDESVGKQ